jgi:preprotein translocase subunit YajC
MPFYDLILLQQAAPTSGNPLISFLPLLLIVAIFYFLVFMPMQRQRKQQQQMLRELNPGDVVVTSGGIVGTIVSLSDDRLVLRVKPGDTKLEFLRSAVSSRAEDNKELKKA